MLVIRSDIHSIAVILIISVLGTGDLAVNKDSLPSSGEIGDKQAIDVWQLGLEHLGGTSDLTYFAQIWQVLLVE